MILESMRDELISCISDTFKDIYGSRPRHYNFASLTIQEMREIRASLYEQAEDEIESERHYQEVKAEEAKVFNLYNSKPLKWEDEELESCF